MWRLPDAGWVWWLLLVFIVAAARVARGFLSWRVTIYGLTSRRVIESTGVLRKRAADQSLEKLADIVLKQSILGRMLDYGDVTVLTAAASAGINNLKRIGHPAEFKTQMLNAMEQLERDLGGSS